jgi:ABC-type lipoprotein export system ATPase subunit/GNAT superfamily N-acetyltransferase
VQAFDLVVETPSSTSIRARQVSSMFDVPIAKKTRLEWHVELELDQPWNVGLLVGPSGAGKSSIMRHIWGAEPVLNWGAPSVIDDFSPGLSIEDIAGVCQAVGFNTIPAWLRPYAVLSNGERFRADLARRMLELPNPIVVDEFTSVVDRQVAQIGSHAVQKWVRRNKRQFVAVTCHYDVIEWLQPDWVLDMATRQFSRRLLQRRPRVDVVIGRVPTAAWSLFAPFHYMTAKLHCASTCFGAWAAGRLAAFLAIRPMPVSTGKGRGTAIWMVSRVVTLPDWQGLGLAMILQDAIAAQYRGAGHRFRCPPAHPSFVRTFDRSPNWKLIKPPGQYSAASSNSLKGSCSYKYGGRPCAIFEYVGAAAEPTLLPLSQLRWAV